MEIKILFIQPIHKLETFNPECSQSHVFVKSAWTIYNKLRALAAAEPKSNGQVGYCLWCCSGVHVKFGLLIYLRELNTTGKCCHCISSSLLLFVLYVNSLLYGWNKHDSRIKRTSSFSFLGLVGRHDPIVLRMTPKNKIQCNAYCVLHNIFLKQNLLCYSAL